MGTGELTVKVSADIDRSIYDMVEIAEAIDEIIDLVPQQNKIVALAIKSCICDKMTDWIDANEA